MDGPARPTPTATSTGCSSWLDTHGLGSIKVQERGHRWVTQIREKDVGKYTSRVVNFVEGAAISIGKLLFSAVVVLVVSIYMLLDFSRLARGSTGASHRAPARSRCSCGWSTPSSAT